MPLPRPAAVTSGAANSRRCRAIHPKPRAACSAPDGRSPARPPKLICAPAASPAARLARLCAITPRSITARRAMLRSKSGRLCLLQSPIPAAGSPASSAPGSIAAGPTRRRSPILAARSAICSAMASASAPPRDVRALAGEGIETDARAQIGIADAAHDRRALGQPPRRPRPLPCRCLALYVARDNDAAGRKAAERLHERGEALGIEVATSCRSTAISMWTSAVSAPRRCSAHLAAQLAPADVRVSPARRRSARGRRELPLGLVPE